MCLRNSLKLESSGFEIDATLSLCSCQRQVAVRCLQQTPSWPLWWHVPAPSTLGMWLYRYVWAESVHIHYMCPLQVLLGCGCAGMCVWANSVHVHYMCRSVHTHHYCYIQTCCNFQMIFKWFSNLEVVLSRPGVPAILLQYSTVVCSSYFAACW